MIRIIWDTPEFLGVISNGQISYFSVSARASDNTAVIYTLIGTPTFPRCLYFNAATGELVGRVSYQSKNTNQTQNQITDYTFTVRATSVSNTSVRSEKTFRFSTKQEITTPYDNLYMKLLLPKQQRDTLYGMLADQNLVPTNYLYRPTDPYYGYAKSVNYQHAFGIPTSISCKYANAVLENYYRRDIVLGEIKTAIARNANNEIIYEVVYSSIVDDLVNNSGISISKTVNWPRIVDNQTQFYPASLPNMRLQIADTLGVVPNIASTLPLWMTSQQLDGNITGYVPAAVLCYTKPGYSQYIVNNINEIWNNNLNNFQFSIDRIIVDRSLSYQYYNGATPSPPSNISGFNGTAYIVNSMNDNDEYIYTPLNILSNDQPIPNC